MYLNGPASGGGVTKSVCEVIAAASVLMPRDWIQTSVTILEFKKMLLRDIAHSRTGDKGNRSTISVIAYDLKDYPAIERALTAERVQAHYAGIAKGRVDRYVLPHLGALNFVLHHALGGGVTRSLALDAHGKCLSSAIFSLDIESLDIKSLGSE